MNTALCACGESWKVSSRTGRGYNQTSGYGEVLSVDVGDDCTRCNAVQMQKKSSARGRVQVVASVRTTSAIRTSAKVVVIFMPG